MADDIEIQDDNTGNDDHLSKNDILDILNEGDENEEQQDDNQNEDENQEDNNESEENDEDAEVKEEDDEEIDDDDERLREMSPSSRSKILAKYPNIFKEFPYLQTAWYREQKYTEIFPAIEDARTALERAQTLEKFEDQISSGNVEEIFKTVKGQDEQSFAKIVDNFLPTLARIDKNASDHIIGNITKVTVMSMMEAAKATKNEDLETAAGMLFNFVFGAGAKWSQPDNYFKGQANNPEQERLNKERQDFLQTRIQTAHSEISSRAQNIIRSTVEKSIDPKNVMTEYVKNTAIREVIERVDRMIVQDNRYRAINDRLWQQAIKENFSRESTERIRKNYLNKARTLLPQIIRSTAQKALKGFGRGNNRPANTDRKGPLRPGKSAAPNTSGNGGKKGGSLKEYPKGMKTEDYLNSFGD